MPAASSFRPCSPVASFAAALVALLPLAIVFAVNLHAAEPDPDRDPAWVHAHEKPAPTADETRAFMKRLATHVVERHMKRDDSPQRGMIYEYFHVARAGRVDQFIQGEALDTMHDGCWFAAAMATAHRATNDPFYKEILTEWQLPFYLKMLNHSDELFTTERNDARADAAKSWYEHKEWMLQPGEKGFVPYWWDDGSSVSLEMSGRRDGDERLSFPGRNEFAGKPNPERRLSGYSFGSSNHLAQDLAILLQLSWLSLRDSADPDERKLVAEIVEAAKNLEACRARHGSPGILGVRAALALVSSDAAGRAKLGEESWKSLLAARNDYHRALHESTAARPVAVPAFADNQQYFYYASLARTGDLTPAAAYKLVYEAHNIPQLYRIYSDDSPAPPGVNVFDLHPYKFVDGKPADLRSQRKGPAGRPRPIGSRFGPQNMVVSGWALQLLKTHPGLVETARENLTTPNYAPTASADEIRASLERELAGGLRTWEAIFAAKGYIPTGLGAGNCGAGFAWEELSDSGGHAHLISAASQWLFLLENRTDWESLRVPPLGGETAK